MTYSEDLIKIGLARDPYTEEKLGLGERSNGLIEKFTIAKLSKKNPLFVKIDTAASIYKGFWYSLKYLFSGLDSSNFYF